jgi:hypothetical protein
VEHPLTSPLVEAIVSYTCSYSCWDTDFLHGEFRGHCIALSEDRNSVQVGTIDSVMGLPKALTEKLIKESLSEP